MDAVSDMQKCNIFGVTSLDLVTTVHDVVINSLHAQWVRCIKIIACEGVLVYKLTDTYIKIEVKFHCHSYGTAVLVTVHS